MVKKEEENKKEVWSMDDLISLTNELQTADIKFRGKTLTVQYCELTEKEEPCIRYETKLSIRYRKERLLYGNRKPLELRLC